jgi:hypothetical protein
MMISTRPAGVMAMTLLAITSVTQRLPSWSKPQPSVAPKVARCSTAGSGMARTPSEGP